MERGSVGTTATVQALLEEVGFLTTGSASTALDVLEAGIEDFVEDIVGKAMRGYKISVQDLASKSGASSVNTLAGPPESIIAFGFFDKIEFKEVFEGSISE